MVDGSPADGAGLQVGDRVTRVGPGALHTGLDRFAFHGRLRFGEPIPIAWTRQGIQHSSALTVSRADLSFWRTRAGLVMQAALPALTCAQQSIAGAILTLQQAGAQEFLVWTSPNPGLTPAIRSLGPGAMQVAAAITTLFNSQLLIPTVALDQTPGLDIAVLDAFALLQNISANPANFGLTNTTTACVTPNAAPFFCAAPDEYLFWDGIHPTRAAHTLVALEAGRVLGQ